MREGLKMEFLKVRNMVVMYKSVNLVVNIMSMKLVNIEMRVICMRLFLLKCCVNGFIKRFWVEVLISFMNVKNRLIFWGLKLRMCLV